MTNNQLIAQFMGWKMQPDISKRWHEHWFDGNIRMGRDKDIKLPLLFHSSWDWLMPVVEKIELLGYTTSFKTNYVRINPKENCSYYNYISYLVFNNNGWYLNHPYVSYDDEADHAPIDRGEDKISKLNAIYKVVVEFIKWYNKNK